MSIRRPFGRHGLPSLSFLLLLGLLALLWLAGGASRVDVAGQAVVRGGATVALVIALLFARPRPGAAGPVLWLLLATIALVLVQLVPLPPDAWQSLPGRAPFIQAVSGAQPWRPLSIVPDATVNALMSLLVPLAVLVLATGLEPGEREFLPPFLLCLIGASMLLGLLQFSGTSFRNPLLNIGSDVSGSFANRNHFALFIAMGCLVALVWAFPARHEKSWRSLCGLGAILLFLLMILASGSRIGMILGAIAVAAGVVLAWPGIRRVLRRTPRWMRPLLITATVVTIGLFVLISVLADRAQAINRAFALEPGEDMRVRTLPKALEMTAHYFPFGTGFGSFDQIFRLHEPFEFLKLTYFNHAHNDFMEVALDGGLAAILLLVAALIWWTSSSIQVWRSAPSVPVTHGRLGSAMLLLVLIASAFDYPARTPMIMAVIILSALWLRWGAKAAARSPLPEHGQHL